MKGKKETVIEKTDLVEDNKCEEQFLVNLELNQDILTPKAKHKSRRIVSLKERNRKCK